MVKSVKCVLGLLFFPLWVTGLWWMCFPPCRAEIQKKESFIFLPPIKGWTCPSRYELTLAGIGQWLAASWKCISLYSNTSWPDFNSCLLKQWEASSLDHESSLLEIAEEPQRPKVAVLKQAERKKTFFMMWQSERRLMRMSNWLMELKVSGLWSVVAP